jgi:sugar fermentation stimulation protein A
LNRFILFNHVLKARFLNRPNRFLVRLERKGRSFPAFLPNPGRLQELLLPGSQVYLTRERKSESRKTQYTVVAVEREGRPVMLDTQRTNEVARRLIQGGKIPGFEKAEIIRSEVRVGRSRFDFLLKQGTRDVLLEVKSCTLLGERTAMFPDAVTERGTRHLRELAKLSEEGTSTAVLFVVHWPLARFFMPDYHTDLAFSETFLGIRDHVQTVPIAVQWNSDLSLGLEARLLNIPWDYIKEEAKDRGSYLLVLRMRRKRRIRVGRLGEVAFERGFYIYVGSAMANLSQRMERHRRKRKRRHWHIDELREVSEFRNILAIRCSERLECEIAEGLSRIAEWTIPGFGCSDCSCESHLFGLTQDPFHSQAFHRLVQYFRMDRFGKGLSAS